MNNNVKVISIPLWTILAVIAIIVGIVGVANKAVKGRDIEASINISNVEEDNEISNLRATQTVSSRSIEISRSEAIMQESNDDKESKMIITENTEEQENDKQEELEEETNNYICVKDITISQDMDLTEHLGISREDFIDLISRVKADSSKFFYNNAGIIYDLCQEYELNEIFFCGLISAESGWNIASNHRSTFNYISLMVNGKLKQFASVEDGLEQAAKSLHENYLTPGGKFFHGKTLAGVKTRFCPSSSTWTSLVYGRMNQIYNSK